MKIPAFARSAFKYTAANLLNAIIPILLLPVLTNYLSKEEYGLVSLFHVMVMATIPFVGLNTQGAIEREYFNKTLNFPAYVSNSFYLVTLSGIFFLIIFLLFRPVISTLTEFPMQFLWVIPFYCIFHNLTEIVLSIWRVENNAASYGILRIGRTFVEVCFSILLVTSMSRGWMGRVEGMSIAVTMSGIIASFILLKKELLGYRLVLPYLKNILKFGVPLIPHTLGGVIMIYSDRVFIAKMVGVAETGSYTVGYQIAMAISLLQSSFNLAWVPWFYGKLGENNDATNRKLVKLTYLYNFAIVFCAIGLTAFSPFLFRWFIGETYSDSNRFVFWVAMGFAFDGMYKMVVNYIFYAKKTYIISVATLATAGLNIVLNYFFIKAYGPIGAAKATTLCMCVEFIVVWFISNRVYPMPWSLKSK